jgi:hypothetical protein
MVVLRNGQAFFDSHDREMHVGVVPEPAVYRVEVYVPETAGEPPIPWIVSNPIYVGMREAHDAAARQAAAAPASRRASVATESWGAEASAGSVSTLNSLPAADGAGLEWRYQLAGGRADGQYAALRFPVDGLAGHDRVQLRGRASRPVRVWLQVRASTVGSGDRWGATFYLEPQLRSVDVKFDDLRPLGTTSMPRPPLDRIDVVLLVADTVNTLPGGSGEVQIAELWLSAP